MYRSSDRRPAVAFVAWSFVPGRSHEIARDLGGEARCYYDLGITRRWLVPLRYALSAGRTAFYLLWRRPNAVIATNPPILLGLIAYVYAKGSGVPLLLDSHPDAFDLGGRHGRLLGINRWLAQRATASLVTAGVFVETVRSWGGQAEVLHEAPPGWEPTPARALAGRLQALFVCTFSHEEPAREVVEAARLTPAADVRITGDLRRAPSGLEASAPRNVAFTGFLPGDEYRRAVEEADVVIALTRWSDRSALRSAYEAVYALRPLIVSDSEHFRSLFPYAIHVENDAASIAAGIAEAAARQPELVAAAPKARALQEERWRHQVDLVREHIRERNRATAGVETPPPARRL